MKRVLTFVLVLALVLSLVPAFALTAAAETDPYESLLFTNQATKVGTTRTLAASGGYGAVVYETWRVNRFVTQDGRFSDLSWTGPDSNLFRMYIYIPVTIDGVEVEQADLDSAPMMLQVNWGGDSATQPTDTSAPGGLMADALRNGWIGVNPGMLGNGQTGPGPDDMGTIRIGKFPYPIACLKSAVTYLRYGSNLTDIPGNKDLIFATGNSSGGCGSALLAASGNNPIYFDAMADIGALPGKDNIAGCASGCPILPRDYSEDAMAWMRFFNVDLDAVDTTDFTAAQLNQYKANKGLKASFIEQMPKYGIKAVRDVGSVQEGDLLTTDNIIEYYHPYYEQSIIKHLNTLASREAVLNYLVNTGGAAGPNNLSRLVPIFEDEESKTVIGLENTPEDFYDVFNNYVWNTVNTSFGGGLRPRTPQTVMLQHDGGFFTTNTSGINSDVGNNAVTSSGAGALGTATFGMITDVRAAYSPFSLKWVTDPENQGVTISDEYMDWYELQWESSCAIKNITDPKDRGIDSGRYYFLRTGGNDHVAFGPNFLNIAAAAEDQGFLVNAAFNWGQGHSGIIASNYPEFFEWFYDVVMKDYEKDPEEDETLILTTEARLVKAGDYFTLDAAFVEEMSSNAAILTYTFDGDKFEYANFAAAEGTQVVNTEYDKGIAKITVVSMGYDLQSLGQIMLRAKEDAQLVREYQSVKLDAEYVLKDGEVKTIETADASASFTTAGNGTEPYVPGDTNGDGVVDLIDLSNMIDWFGIDSSHPDWNTTYVFFDFTGSGEINIANISYVAKLI